MVNGVFLTKRKSTFPSSYINALSAFNVDILLIYVDKTTSFEYDNRNVKFIFFFVKNTPFSIHACKV